MAIRHLILTGGFSTVLFTFLGCSQPQAETPIQGLIFNGDKTVYELNVAPNQNLHTDLTASKELWIHAAFKDLSVDDMKFCERDCITLSYFDINGDELQWGSSGIGVGFSQVESGQSHFLISHVFNDAKTIVVTIGPATPANN